MAGKQRALDLTDKRFGRLIALYPTKERYGSYVLWHCKCNCGKEKDVPSALLVKGITRSCGCLAIENSIEQGGKNLQDLTGQVFGKLTALYLLDKRGRNGHTYWHCKCKCGNETDVRSGHLKSGQVQSCGCISSSIGEENIKTLLINNEIPFEKEKTFIDLVGNKNRKYHYDFYLPEYNRLIEFDGEQHYKCDKSEKSWNTEESIVATQKRDRIKNEYALSHNISLVRIPYWERDKITLEMILGDQYLVRRND